MSKDDINKYYEGYNNALDIPVIDILDFLRDRE